MHLGVNVLAQLVAVSPDRSITTCPLCQATPISMRRIRRRKLAGQNAKLELQKPLIIRSIRMKLRQNRMKQATVSGYLSLTFIVLFVSSVQDSGAQQKNETSDKCFYEVRSVLLKKGIKQLEKPDMEKVREYCERGEVERATSYVMNIKAGTTQECTRGLNNHIKMNGLNIGKDLYSRAYDKCRTGDLQNAIALLGGETTEADPAPAEIVSFAASSSNVKKGNPVTLSWHTINANTVMLGIKGTSNFQSVEATGSKTITPDKTSTYVLMAGQSTKKGPAAMTSKGLQVNVSYDPVIGKLFASPSTLRKGQKSELSWQVYAADEVTLDGIPVPHIGEKNVSPNRSTTYTLKAWTGDKLIQELVRVSVSPYQQPRLSHPFYQLELCREIDKSGESFRCMSPDGPFWNGDKIFVIARFRNLASGQHKVNRIIHNSGVFGDRNWTEYHQEESNFRNSTSDGVVSFEIPSMVNGVLKLEIIMDDKKSNTSVIEYCVECPGHDEW